MANDLTLIGSAGSNCSSTPYYEIDGCADCVPYKKFIPLSDCKCPSDEIKYVNLNDGTITTTEPANFTVGACSDKVDGKVCYKLNDNGTDINVSVTTSRCCVTYYENGVEVTDTTRISVLKALIEAADCDAVVDCVAAVNSDICYEFTSGGGGGGGGGGEVELNGWYNAVGFEDSTVTPGQRIEIVRIGPSPGVPLTTPILLSASSPTPESIASVQAAAEGEMLTRVKAVIPNIDTVLVRLETYGDGERVWQFLFYDSANLLRDYTGTCAYDPDGCPALGFWRAQDGGQVGENRGGSLEQEPVVLPGGGGGGGGGTTTSIKVITVNGVTTYYENGTEVTDSTRIAEIEAQIAAATASNVVCCPDCAGSTATPLDVLTTTQPTPTTTGNTTNLNSVFKDANGNTWIVDSNGDAVMAGSVANPLNVLTTAQATPTATGNTTNLNSVFKDANGDTWIVDSNGDAILVETPPPDGQVCYGLAAAPVTQTYAVVESLEFFNGTAGVPYYLTQIRLRSVSSGATLGTVNFSPPLQVWDGTSRITPAAFITALNSAGYLAAVQAVDPRIDRFDVVQTSNSNRIYAFDNQNLITSANRIFAHTSDYSLSATGTPINNTINNGAYTNITSTYTPSTDLYKVVTANGVTEYYKNDVLLTAAADITAAQTAIAAATPADVVSCVEEQVTCQAVMDTQTFTATAGQTTFTLINAPSGDVRFSRNGASLSDNAATVTGSTVTYVPAANNGTALLSGDRIEISYVYNVCTGGAAPTIADGSETKVTAGTGVTVTGAGTTGNPYVVSTSGSRASFASMVKSGQSPAPAAGSLVTWGATSQTYGTNVIADPATETFLLKAGFVYEIDVQLQAEFTNIEGYFNYGIYQGTTATSLPTQIGTPGKVYGQNATFGGGGKYSVDAHAYVVATVDTYVGVKSNARSSVSSLSAYEGASWFAAKVIGTI